MIAPFHVTCLGFVCPVGLTVKSACAAMRAGIDGFAETGYLDKDGEPIIGALVPGVPSDLHPRARLVELLSLAMQDALGRLPKRLPIEEIPVLFCCPDGSATVFRAVAERLRFQCRRELSKVVPGEHVAAFTALRQARELLASGRCAACLVVAVDSLMRARSLLALERHQRLLTPVNSDGVLPGEAAAVALVTAGRQPDMPGVALLGLGTGEETATVLNEEPLLGKGMAAAVRGALAEAGLQMSEIAFRLSDVAGESYAFEELSLTLSRVLRQRLEELPLWHPADKVGDCGGAAGLLQLAWAEQAFARGYAPGSVALCHASAAAGFRAAAALTR